MIKITTILVLATCAVFAGEPKSKVPAQSRNYMATSPAPNSRATFYNSSAQKTGSAQTTGNITTFRDNANRTTGRAQKTSNSIIFTDSINRTQGKATITK